MTTTTEADPLEILPDHRKSRYTKKDPGSELPTNPDDLATVDAKVAEFWRLHPNGIIDSSDVEQIGEAEWRVTTRVWKDRGTYDEAPDVSASSTRRINLDGHEAEAFPLESAQSISILRSLRFLGITAKGDTIS